LLDGTGTLLVGESVEVSFTVTIDPDGVDSVSQGLENQGTLAGDGINPDTGAPDPALSDSDDSNSGSAPDAVGDDPTTIVIADLAIAKAAVGAPVEVADGNFDVTYQVVVENNGTVDLANLSLLEDLATQYGGLYVDAYGLTMVTAPSDTGSSVSLNAAWDGTGVVDLVDQSASNALAIGDSFVIEFTVTVDPSNATGNETNTVSGTGDAVDENGDPITDSNGDPVTASDDSDSGTDPSNDNPNDPGNTGGTDDPTPLQVPSLGLAKQAGVAVPNGDDWDIEFTFTVENTGTVSLADLTLMDDIASQFGNAYVSANGLAVQNFSGTGSAPTANSGWLGDTSQSLISGGTIEVGDTFEVVVTITIDPDGIDGTADPLENTATGGGNAVDQNGDPITDSNGDPLTAQDDSDNGTDADGENGGDEDGNGSFADDPTPIVIADLGIAKDVVATTALDNGNFEVTYQVTVENTGTVDLANLSLLEDIATQFGSAYVDAYGLTLTTAPTDAGSSVAVDGTWDGSGTTEMVDAATPSILAVGDSLVLEFTVEVDVNAAGAPSPINNTVTGGGDAVDENGAPLTDPNGNPITAEDDSDSGSDPNGDNPSDPGNNGTSDDPTPLLIPDVGIAKTAGDAVANGDNWDVAFTLVFENTGTVTVDNLTMLDDIAAEFGNAFVSVDGLAIVNFAGTGTAPGANAAWAGDTTQNILDGTGSLNVGDSFEVVFTVTIDPDGIDNVSQGLTNQATGSGDGVNPDGSPMTDANGDPVTGTDDSDSGTDAGGENNGDENNDGVSDNDPTQIVIADIAVAKETVGAPTRLANGNFEVTYQLVIENNGTVDLANLSLVEDLATQFGAVYQGGSGLAMVTGPTDPASSITLDAANWDGSATTEIVDQTAASLLAIGDSFTIEFIVEVDPTRASGPIANTVTAGGDAVDQNGDPLTDSNGDPVTASDASDSGSDPNDGNPGTPGDTGGTDDPTPLQVPSIAIAKSAADAVANGDNWDLTFTLVIENDGTVDLTNLSVMDDLAAEFGNAYVSASGLSVENFSGSGTPPTANNAWLSDTSQSITSGGTLELGDTFEVVFTVTIDPDGVDSMAQGLQNQATAAGDALDENGNPLVDDSGNPVVASDDSDNGTNPHSENSDVDTPGDGVYGNDPTPIVIADISAAKSVAGTPIALANGNFEVTYEVIIENTGTVDLANLTVIEDLATQFGASFISASGLTLTTSPSDATSAITVDGAWDGSGATELIDSAAATLLAVGDSFAVQFTVEVDLDANGSSEPISNQVVAGGDAIDENGNPISDSNGDPITAEDDSDSGSDPSSDNPNDQGDNGTSDDSTPLLIPDVGVAKTASDPVANGDNFDVTFTLLLENTGTVSLDGLTLTDDVMSQFGNAFVSASGLTVSNFIGTGTAPTANADWLTDSTQNLLSGGTLETGDLVEVTFVVTIDPDGVDSMAQSLTNEAVGSGNGINPDGSPMTDANGDPVVASDDSDNGTDPNDPGNDPTPILIADLGIAKQVVGTPLPVGENFEVTYQVVVENTGTVDLANISLLEDLSGQYGSALISAGSAAVVSPATATGSSFTANSAFDGNADTQLAAAGSTLAIGDSVTIEFKVVVDLAAAGAANPLVNQIVGSGDAIDENGDPILDSNGDPVVGTDDSDSGSDPSNSNPGDSGDNGTSEDPTPLLIPDVGVAKSAGDAVENGENFDVTFTLVFQNTGTVALESLSLIDDVEAQFGDAFLSASGLTIANFSGTGTAPTANPGWAVDTAANMLLGGTVNPGDQFEVNYTVTIDPDASGVSDGLVNQATGSGAGLNPDGSRLIDGNGNPYSASDLSDSGSDAVGDNGEGSTADPTSVIIADLGIAKAIVGTPEVLFNGNSIVTFEVVIENTGTVDLANLSLIEDLATQFGDAFISSGDLTSTVGTTDPASSITIDTAGFDGAGSPELLDQSVNNVLAVGDSFTIQFSVEVDPDGVGTGGLENHVSGSGAAVDANGDPLLDSNGNPISGTDLSDAGSNASGNNPGEVGDTGSSEDPTLFTPEPRALGTISGAVFVDANGDGIQDPGEAGIEGVEVTLVGEDVFGNAVEITTLTDAEGNYVFEGLNAGTYQIIETQPEDFDDGGENSEFAASIGNDSLNDITLGFGQNLGNNSFAELDGSVTSGNPSRLPGLLPFGGSQRFANQISNFLGAPGPIYSGVPIASNGNPLTLESGRPVTGGYATEFASPDAATDCGCPEVIETPCEVVEPCQPCAEEVIQETTCDPCQEQEVISDSECQVCEEPVACEECSDCGNCCDCGSVPQKLGVLFRLKNWLSR
jgi:hypothetical protein